ncbi:MAG: hypothetical protein K9N06_04175 [Candidatus Cloacimonetes bacterium]|nr:hypothetical protein [Candidatus Cloacimonadota bacterium]
MKSTQDSSHNPVIDQSLFDQGALMMLDVDEQQEKSRFQELLSESGFEIGEQGICQVNQKGVKNIASIFNISYLYNKMAGHKKIRFIKIDDTVFEITPEHLVHRNDFRKLLLSENYNLTCSNRLFNILVNIIIKMDNNKFINDKAGFGKIAEHIYNFGNKILVNNRLIDFKPNIWLGKKGYHLSKTDMLNISENPLNPSLVWHTFFKLYGMQADLIIGFAVAALFFQEYMKKEKNFPLLYIKAGSGRGKDGLTELFENLFGIKHPFASVNCAGNSTKIGIESKSILLNNLPLILNELTEKEFLFIKSRYDGQGSVKYSEFKPGNISERTVNGPTVITTVVDPKDKQIISRCVFINLDITEMQKKAFEQARNISKEFSSFNWTVLNNISFTDIITQIEQFKRKLDCSVVQPRICDNYSLIAGGFLAFASLLPNSNELPDFDSLQNFLITEMKKTEDLINPLCYFLREIERLSECKFAQKYITQDENYLYFNFNGVWSLIPKSYKDEYFPFITSSYIKNLIIKSKYIAHYGRDFAADENNPSGKPVYNFPKCIKNSTRKCFMLLISELPGYYK